MTVELGWLIAFVSTALGIFNIFKNWKKNDTTDIVSRVEEQTKINVKLDQIIGDTKDIKGEMSYMQRDIKSLTERLIKVEESSKQAHHRLDKFDNRECKHDER